MFLNMFVQNLYDNEDDVRKFTFLFFDYLYCIKKSKTYNDLNISTFLNNFGIENYIVIID